jgi:hypothetical protein
MRVYTIVSASILLFFGIVAFAFSDQFHVPTYALLVDLILGLWGMVAIFSKK